MLDDMSIVQPVMDWIVARSAWETYTNHLKVLSNDQLHVFLKLRRYCPTGHGVDCSKKCVGDLYQPSQGS